MLVVKLICPDCQLPLRLRKPIQSPFECPACSVQIEARGEGDDIALSVVQPLTVPSGAGATLADPTNAKLIGIGVAVVALVAGTFYLNSSGADEKPEAERTRAKSSAALAQDQTQENDAAAAQPLDDPEVIEPVADNQTPPKPDRVAQAQPVDNASLRPIGAVTPPGRVPKPVELEPRPVETVVQTREDIRKKLAMDMLNLRLAVRLKRYQHQKPVSLAAFLSEMSDLMASKFQQLPGEQVMTAESIQLALEDCTIGEVLTAGLGQASLRYELRHDGIYLSATNNDLD